MSMGATSVHGAPQARALAEKRVVFQARPRICCSRDCTRARLCAFGVPALAPVFTGLRVPARPP
eukprot:13534347-Alexandrium_andersonii.AAC.1